MYNLLGGVSNFLKLLRIALYKSLKGNLKYASFLGSVVNFGKSSIIFQKKVSLKAHFNACASASASERLVLKVSSNYLIFFYSSGIIFLDKSTKSFLALSYE